MEIKEKIVISAVNLVDGGTWSILKQCLDYLESDLSIHSKYSIVAIVHNKSMFKYKNIEFLEYPKSKKNWFLRIYYEYYLFYKLSLKLKPYLWLSLHDMTPNVKAKYRAVYCHNSTPFYKVNIKDLKFSYKVFLFSCFYKYLYKINIKKNDFIIVQQNWIRRGFCDLYSLNENNVIVAYPNEERKNIKIDDDKTKLFNIFFFPSLPRLFKNFEVICMATEYLIKKGIRNFKVILTINGCENPYSKYVYNKYKSIPNIDFVGLLSSDEMIDRYKETKCLIFPSKLETWGLPISEFKEYKKPMIVSDLPYAYETSSGAKQVAFFQPDDYQTLAHLMCDVINDNFEKFKPVDAQVLKQPYADSWKELFNILLNDKYGL